MPWLSAPSTTERPHHLPRGSRRTHRSSRSPGGRTREAAAKSGLSGGSQSCVTAYVEPQTTGGTTVSPNVQPVLPLTSMEDTLPSEEGKVEAMDHVSTVVEQWAAER